MPYVRNRNIMTTKKIWIIKRLLFYILVLSHITGYPLIKDDVQNTAVFNSRRAKQVVSKEQSYNYALINFGDGIGNPRHLLGSIAHKPCPHRCICTETHANCSGVLGKHTFVPALPENITFLDFSHNNMTSIDSDAFFYNVTNITGLDLSYNGLMFASSGAFKSFTNLTFLILNYNNITNSLLQLVLSIHTLETLGLNFTNLGPLPNSSLCPTPHARLRYLYLVGNNLKFINFSVFTSCVDLEVITLGFSSICDLISDRISSLQYLYLNYNKLSTFPETCQNNSSLLPSLIELNLNVNQILTISSVCLPKLKTLHISYNRFEHIDSFTFNAAKFPSLIQLSVTSITKTTEYIFVERNAFSIPTLQLLTFSMNRISFADNVSVNPDAFAGCYALKHLDLKDNIFTDISVNKFLTLFSHLTSLRSLDISYCQITTFNEISFKGLYFLQSLNMIGNSISSIPDGTFDNIANLKILILEHNKLTSIKKTTFSSKTRHSLQRIYLGNNPFECSCDIMWFRRWILSNESLFPDIANYKCNDVLQTRLKDFYLPDQACLLNNDVFALTVVTVSLVLITLTLTAVFYRFRWHIRLILHETFRDRTESRRQSYLQSGTFPYDVFVSYAAEDLAWVLEHLLPELEERMGLRLCIHQRDFVPGVNIVDNIVQNLEKSKKVLLLFSNQFARSQWCQFELALCLQHVMDRDDILVIVILEEISHRVLTNTMLAVLKVTTYIQWEDDIDARASFWSRMHIAFKELLPFRRSRNC